MATFFARPTLKFKTPRLLLDKIHFALISECDPRGFIQILRDGKKENPSAEREDRKRSKIIRKKKKKFKS